MELKHTYIIMGKTRIGLLIVPYGIETKNWFLQKILSVLLIVPYGIETEFLKIR